MTRQAENMSDIFGEVISTYSRAEAIGDGVLVDLTEWASADKGFMGGFTTPVAVTAAVWAMIEAIPPKLDHLQDVRGRAHDVLYMASLACRGVCSRKIGPDRTRYTVAMWMAGDDPADGSPSDHKLDVHVGPGDKGEVVITIMLPNED